MAGLTVLNSVFGGFASSSLPQGDADAAAGTADAVVIPPASLGKAAVVDAAVASVQAQMAADRKTTALKSLQVLTTPPRSQYGGHEQSINLHMHVPACKTLQSRFLSPAVHPVREGNNSEPTCTSSLTRLRCSCSARPSAEGFAEQPRIREQHPDGDSHVGCDWCRGCLPGSHLGGRVREGRAAEPAVRGRAGRPDCVAEPGHPDLHLLQRVQVPTARQWSRMNT